MFRFHDTSGLIWGQLTRKKGVVDLQDHKDSEAVVPPKSLISVLIKENLMCVCVCVLLQILVHNDIH